MHQFAFEWANPQALHWLWALPLLVLIYAIAWHQRNNALRRIAQPQLLWHLTAGVHLPRYALKVALVTGGIALMILSLARPRIASEPTVVRVRGINVLFALDVSNSMLAEDVHPNRLMVAKDQIRALVERLDSARIGLIVFAGTAHQICPLTTDYDAFEVLLDAADTSMVQMQGTSFSELTMRAVWAFERAERWGQDANEGTHKRPMQKRILVVVSDGEDQGSNLERTIERLKENNICVYALCIGTSSGVRIPMRDANGRWIGYKRDRRGKVVITRAHPEVLTRLAKATNGAYYQLDDSAFDIGQLADTIRAERKDTMLAREYRKRRELFPIPLALSIALLCVEWLIAGYSGRKRA